MYGCESWTLRKNEETRLEAFEMKGLRKVLRVSWTAKKTNEWVLNKAGVKRELLDTVKARKLTYYSHTMRKQGNCLEKEIMQGTMPGVRRRRRHLTAWIDNIKLWIGFSVEESIRMTQDRDKWRKYVHPWCGQPSDLGRLKNRTEQHFRALQVGPTFSGPAFSGRAFLVLPSHSTTSVKTPKELNQSTPNWEKSPTGLILFEFDPPPDSWWKGRCYLYVGSSTLVLCCYYIPACTNSNCNSELFVISRKTACVKRPDWSWSLSDHSIYPAGLVVAILSERILYAHPSLCTFVFSYFSLFFWFYFWFLAVDKVGFRQLLSERKNSLAHRVVSVSVSALGCPQLKVADNVWIQQERTTAKVKCNSTEETWFLACNGRRWTGELGNCSSVTAQTGNLFRLVVSHIRSPVTSAVQSRIDADANTHILPWRSLPSSSSSSSSSQLHIWKGWVGVDWMMTMMKTLFCCVNM